MNYNVEIIPQQTRNSCWAAAMAMLLQYLSGLSRRLAEQTPSPFATAFTPRYVADQVGGVPLQAYIANRMLSTDIQQNWIDLAAPWRLEPDFHFVSQNSSQWDQLLSRNGPYFVLVRTDELTDHAVIVSGIDQDQLTIVDPWPVSQGSRYRISYGAIRFAGGATGYGTVIHAADNTLVLQPGRGGGW